MSAGGCIAVQGVGGVRRAAMVGVVAMGACVAGVARPCAPASGNAGGVTCVSATIRGRGGSGKVLSRRLQAWRLLAGTGPMRNRGSVVTGGTVVAAGAMGDGTMGDGGDGGGPRHHRRRLSNGGGGAARGASPDPASLGGGGGGGMGSGTGTGAGTFEGGAGAAAGETAGTAPRGQANAARGAGPNGARSERTGWRLSGWVPRNPSTRSAGNDSYTSVEGGDMSESAKTTSRKKKSSPPPPREVRDIDIVKLRGARKSLIRSMKDARAAEALTGAYDVAAAVDGRGLHSSTFQLNLSALYGIGDVRKGLCGP